MTRERDSRNRRYGLAKKANTYSRLFAANTAIIIEDEGQFYLYSSCPKFLPELFGTLEVSPENKFDPDTFESVKDLKQRSPSPTLSTMSLRSSTIQPETAASGETQPNNCQTHLRSSTSPQPTSPRLISTRPTSPPVCINKGKQVKGKQVKRGILAPTQWKAFKGAGQGGDDGALGRLMRSAYFK
ncbi:hypothetical protein F5Y02DRAFT_418978 [Annulohypoxylon stygium]|nr:hypothetical protein F5Y02DRAFT_418978 [Annulohypoxylon stygium]